MFVVIDRASRNIMGEFDTYAEAEALLLDLVGAHPPAASEVEIVSGTGEHLIVDSDRLRDIAWRGAAVTA
jgi:hypothetical protein